ncbi:MAG: hypothetical protein OXE53_13090 [Deltaproteobacteria bacterium]|nr:hypothetical protein [Deltaproteobacteria bacterium]
MSLAIGGTTIPLASMNESQPVRIGGDYARNSEGTPADQGYGMKRVFRCVTVFMDPDEYTAVMAKLELRSEQPLTGTGAPFAMGRVKVLGNSVRSGAGFQRAVRFELLEGGR